MEMSILEPRSARLETFLFGDDSEVWPMQGQMDRPKLGSLRCNFALFSSVSPMLSREDRLTFPNLG